MKLIISDEYIIKDTRDGNSYKCGTFSKNIKDDGTVEYNINSSRYYGHLEDALEYIAEHKLRLSDAEGFDEVAQKQEEIKALLEDIHEELEKGRLKFEEEGA